MTSSYRSIAIASATISYSGTCRPLVSEHGDVDPLWRESALWRDNFEVVALVEMASRLFTQVYLVDLSAVTIVARRQAQQSVWAGAQDISTVSALVVRGTGGHFEIARALSAVLKSRGCCLLDDLPRFGAGTASKMSTTLTRHDRQVGSSSIVGDAQAWHYLFDGPIEPSDFPLLYKPPSGRQGRGIVVLDDPEALRSHLSSLANESDEPFLLQRMERFAHEYRALLLHGSCLGVAEKIAEDGIPANAATGAAFTPVSDGTQEMISRFVERSCPGDCLTGVDVGELTDGSLRIIEENAAPQWQAFDAALGTNAAELIIRRLAHMCEGRA